MYTCEGGPWESSSNFLCFLVQNFGGGGGSNNKNTTILVKISLWILFSTVSNIYMSI